MIIYYVDDKNATDRGCFIDVQEFAYAPTDNDQFTIAGIKSTGKEFSKNISRNGLFTLYDGTDRVVTVEFHR